MIERDMKAAMNKLHTSSDGTVLFDVDTIVAALSNEEGAGQWTLVVDTCIRKAVREITFSRKYPVALRVIALRAFNRRKDDQVVVDRIGGFFDHVTATTRACGSSDEDDDPVNPHAVMQVVGGLLDVGLISAQVVEGYAQRLVDRINAYNARGGADEIMKGFVLERLAGLCGGVIGCWRRMVSRPVWANARKILEAAAAGGGLTTRLGIVCSMALNLEEGGCAARPINRKDNYTSS